MKKLCSSALLILALATPARATGLPENLSSLTFEQAMCAICDGAGYSPACFTCTIMMMFDAIGGWD